MRERFAADPHRPAYHFLPPANWMNDPNGLIHWRGQYHMFYQYNPNGAFWGTMHWGHAVSADLLRWRDLPIALAPGPEPYDAAGVFSGITLVHEGVPTIMYTATSGAHYDACVALAVGDPDDPDLVSWRKDPANPVLRAPADVDATRFRDHSAWREGDWWYQVIGAGVRGAGGAILLYRSRDLRSWEEVGRPLAGAESETGYMWECPDLFPLGDRHALLLSPMPFERAVVYVGRFDGAAFTPDGPYEELDNGGSLYAPQTMRDAQGRRLLFGWLREDRPVVAQVAAGWSGAMSLPRELTMLPGGALGYTPAAEVETLRGRHVALAAGPIRPGGLALPAALPGDRLEIQAEIDVGAAAHAGLVLRASPGGEERTLVYYDRAAGLLVADRTAASLDADTARDVRSTPLALAPGEPLRLRAFVDRSVLEVFANGRACLTSRVYPTRPDALGAAVFAEGGVARLLAGDAWEVAAVWPIAP